MSDPRITLTANGSSIRFVGGQPMMDNGLENMALISLFTSPGWCGNKLLKVPIGSDFEQAYSQPITRQSLNTIRNAAERALAAPVFGRVTVTVVNPVGHRLEVTAVIGRTGQTLKLTRNRQNWEFQATSGGEQVITPSRLTYGKLDETAILDGFRLA